MARSSSPFAAAFPSTDSSDLGSGTASSQNNEELIQIATQILAQLQQSAANNTQSVQITVTNADGDALPFTTSIGPDLSLLP